MHRPAITPEQRAMIVDLLPQAASLTDIGKIIGLPRHIVRDEARALIAIMRLQGSLPPCDCGRERFHHGHCAFKQRRPDTAQQLTKRALIVAAIMSGEPFRAIDEMLGFASNTSHRYLHYLTPDQRAERERVLAGRDRKDGAFKQDARWHSKEATDLAVRMLIEGASYRDITAATGAPEKSLLQWRQRRMNDEERAARTAAVARRRAAAKATEAGSL